MLLKFRQARKRLEKLQENIEEEYFGMQKISFHQTWMIFKTTYNPEIPSTSVEKIQTISINKIETDYNGSQDKKRRNSSVAKKISFLVSHLKAAVYIILLVLTVIVTFMPATLYTMYESVALLVNKDLLEINDNINGTMVYKCLNEILQDKVCDSDIEIDNDNQDEWREISQRIFHVEESILIDFIIGDCLALFNSMLNPVFYAFWYPDFRKYLAQIRKNILKPRNRNYSCSMSLFNP